MDHYTQIGDYLLNLPEVGDWPDLKEALEQGVAKKPRDWRLPILGGEAVGGASEQIIPASAAIACMQLSIILIDDMLDADPRGRHHKLGMPAAANLATAAQALGIQAILHSPAAATTQLAAVQCLNQMMLDTAYGQYLDGLNPATEDEYWRVVRWKSSPFFGAALQAGALLGGASVATAAGMQRLGHLYGELIQIHDDLNDTMEVPANPDWILGRTPLPILFAQCVDHPDRERFLQLRKAIPDPQALKEAQSILIRCGAVSYTIDQLVRHHRKAVEILALTSLARKEGVESLLEDVIGPVRKLFKEVDFELPDIVVQE
jgi:geranylgeranyl pyrophosphate synthase